MIKIKAALGTFAILVLGSQMAAAQNEIESSEVEFGGHSWLLEQIGEAGARQYLGRQAMFLERARLTLQEQTFSEGVIEFDLASDHASGFVGVNFRNDGDGTGEQFYVRFHQSGRPDATQYLGQMNGLASWQLHAGPNDATAVELGIGEWIPIRIIVQGDKADIFVRDMAEPALHIAHLRTDNEEGNVVFYATERPGMITGAYFSGISVRALEEGEGVTGTPRDEPAVADGVFRTWQISTPLSERQLESNFELDESLTGPLEWRSAAVEENGILNIARYTRMTPEAQTVLVKLVLEAGSPTARQFNFGYSDRVRIYVNGKQQFFGNAQWRSRDHRFLGTVGLHDAVILHLEPGRNEVIAAVSESFGGWGFIGQLEDREGLTVNP